MSSLPPLPPDVQARINQRFNDVEQFLDAFVRGIRVDPKRDPNNLPDYHNTVVAMILKAQQTIPDGAAMNRHMAALAFIILADTGWTPDNPSDDMPPLDDPTKPTRRPKRIRRPKGKR
jgi:hypothetical protein